MVKFHTCTSFVYVFHDMLRGSHGLKKEDGIIISGKMMMYTVYLILLHTPKTPKIQMVCVFSSVILNPGVLATLHFYGRIPVLIQRVNLVREKPTRTWT